MASASASRQAELLAEIERYKDLRGRYASELRQSLSPEIYTILGEIYNHQIRLLQERIINRTMTQRDAIFLFNLNVSSAFNSKYYEIIERDLRDKGILNDANIDEIGVWKDPYRHFYDRRYTTLLRESSGDFHKTLKNKKGFINFIQMCIMLKDILDEFRLYISTPEKLSSGTRKQSPLSASSIGGKPSAKPAAKQAKPSAKQAKPSAKQAKPLAKKK